MFHRAKKWSRAMHRVAYYAAITIDRIMSARWDFSVLAAVPKGGLVQGINNTRRRYIQFNPLMDHMDTLEFQNALRMPLAIAASTWQITPNLRGRYQYPSVPYRNRNDV
jgi:hypothetical protein